MNSTMHGAIDAGQAVSIERADDARRFFWLAAIVIGVSFWMLENQWHFADHDTTLVAEEQVEQYTSSGNLIRRFGFFFIGGFGAWQLIRRDRSALRFDSPALWCLAALAAWATASVLWSVDADMTIRRMVVASLWAIGAVGMASRFPTRELGWMLVAICSAYALIGVASAVTMGAFQPWNSEYRFSGTTHPNMMGLYTSLGCLAVFCMRRSLPGGRALPVFAFAGLFALLMLTRSRTSLVALIAALGAVWLVGVPRHWKLRIGWIVLLIGVVALLGAAFLDPANERSAGDVLAMGRNEEVGSLTGRLPLWTYLLTFLRDRTWIGFGYQAFWNRDHCEDIFDELDWSVSHAHNGYLEMTMGLGVIGAVLFAAALAFGWIQTARRGWATKAPGDVFVSAFLAYGIIHALLESTLAQPTFLSFVAAVGMFRMLLFAEPTCEPEPDSTSQADSSIADRTPALHWAWDFRGASSSAPSLADRRIQRLEFPKTPRGGKRR